MKILILGSGAIGSALGGFLSRKTKVSLVGRKKHINAIKKNGLQITGIWGKHNFKNFDKLYFSPKEILKNTYFDFIFITTKAYSTEEIVKQSTHFLKKCNYVISLQNGLGNWEKISKVISLKKTIGGMVIFGAKILKPGLVDITVFAKPTQIGKLTFPRFDKNLKSLVEVMNQCGLATKFTLKIEDDILAKFLYNCALNPLGAILNFNYGELSTNKHTKNIMNKIIKEAINILKNKKFQIPFKEKQYLKLFYKKLIPPTVKHYPSMLEDLKFKRQTEINFLNGKIVEWGKKLKIKTPYNEILTEIIKAQSLM